MRFILITALLFFGVSHLRAEDTYSGPITSDDAKDFMVPVMKALTPDETTTFNKDMIGAKSEAESYDILTRYAIIVQARGVVLPFHVATIESGTKPTKPDLPGAAPITQAEIGDFATIIRDEMDKRFQGDRFRDELQKVGGDNDARLALITKWALQLQDSGVHFPHPVGRALPAKAVLDNEARVPAVIDPSWSVMQFENKAIRQITKDLGNRFDRTDYDIAGYRQSEVSFPKDQSSFNPQDRSTWTVTREWTQNQHLRTQVCPAGRYSFPIPRLPDDPHYGFKQVIVWNDPKDPLKGAKFATMLPPTEPDASTAYDGGYRSWTPLGSEQEFGTMTTGLRTGPWIERTFDVQDQRDRQLTESQGSYSKGKKIGQWVTTLFAGNPEFDAYMAQPVQPNVVRMSDNLQITQTYDTDGKLLSEIRNYK